MKKEDRYGSEDGGSERKAVTSLAVNVSDTIDDYTWDILLSGHMGLAGMLHRQRRWGLIASRSQLEAKLRSCETCRRHRRVNRDT